MGRKVPFRFSVRLHCRLLLPFSDSLSRTLLNEDKKDRKGRAIAAAQTPPPSGVSRPSLAPRSSRAQDQREPCAYYYPPLTVYPTQRTQPSRNRCSLAGEPPGEWTLLAGRTFSSRTTPNSGCQWAYR